MLMMRPLGASATHSEIGKISPRGAGPVAGTRVLMMLAGQAGEVPRGPMEKRGSDEAGLAALGVVPFAHASIDGYTRPRRNT